MTRRQVLDVGDRVQCLPGARYMLGTITFIDENRAQQSGEVTVTWDRDDQSGNGPFTQEGWTPGDLERLGGDLQLGDFVTVTGTCLSAQCSDDHFSLAGEFGLIVDDYEDGAFMVHCMGEVAAVQARPDQLNRITRVEALACQ